jgi:hypothetical protein
MARDNIPKPKLTTRPKTASLPFPPTDFSYQPANFDFPTLNNDGSVSGLIETHPPPGQRTPPAALSSLGLKMAAEANSNAVTELNDGQYDMVDDVSDDSHETVSIASDALTSDGDTNTPDNDDDDEDDDVYDPRHGLFADIDASAAGRSTGAFPRQSLMLNQQQKQNLRGRRLALQKEYESEKERTLDSFLSEDLETPRQSTVDVFDHSPSINPLRSQPTGSKSPPATVADKRGSSSAQEPSTKSTLKIAGRFVTQAATGLTTSSLLMGVVLVSLFAAHGFFFNGPVSLDARRDALSGALVKLTNSTNATKTFSVDHLLPVPTTLASTNIFGQHEQGTSNVHFQGAQPSYIIVSLPRKAGKSPQVASTAVYRGQKAISFNQTELIDGVYAITLDPRDAYGTVTVAMPCKKPDMNITVSHNFHNFGRRYLDSPIVKTVTKDVALVQSGARGITDIITAGVVATHNVSTQLAQQVGQEAKALASSAALVAEKWYSAYDATATAVRKDLVAVQEGLARAETQVDDYVADVAGRVKRSVMEPLAVAHDRAGRIRAKYFGSDAAREKVCKRDLSERDLLMNGFAEVEVKLEREARGQRSVKNGQLAEKRTCGTCNKDKTVLEPKVLTKNKSRKDKVDAWMAMKAL